MVERNQHDRDLIRTLRLLAPGTPLRTAIDNIQSARTGGLIVLAETPEVERVIEGGFNLDCELTPSKLYELAKMDGAIIVSGDLRRILYANVHLVPDSEIPSFETGIRHRTADRVARQTGALVVAVSQRRNLVTIYKGVIKHVLQETPVILAKANQALQTLDRYRANLDRSLAHLTALEFEDTVTVGDVAATLQRLEIVLRVGVEVSLHAVELGVEGRLVSLQRDELLGNIEEEGLYLIRDYCVYRERPPDEVRGYISGLAGEQLLDLERMAQALGYSGGPAGLEAHVTPRGYRVLRKIPRLPAAVVDNLVARFGSLPAILQAGVSELDEVEGIGEVRANAIRDGLRRIREQTAIPYRCLNR